MDIAAGGGAGRRAGNPCVAAVQSERDDHPVAARRRRAGDVLVEPVGPGAGGWRTHGPPPCRSRDRRCCSSVPPPAEIPTPVRTVPESAREAASRDACGTTAGDFGAPPRGSASATSPIRQTAPHSGQVISQPSPSRSRTGVARQAHGAPSVISMRCGVILRPLHGGGPFAPSGAHYPPPGSRASTSGALDAGQDAPRRRRGQLTGHLPALSRRPAAPETTGAGRTPRAGQPWSPPPDAWELPDDSMGGRGR